MFNGFLVLRGEEDLGEGCWRVFMDESPGRIIKFLCKGDWGRFLWRRHEVKARVSKADVEGGDSQKRGGALFSSDSNM